VLGLLWKTGCDTTAIYTSGWLMTTVCGNGFSQAVVIKATASVNVTFTLAVVL
jgi:hypothetical protein